MLMLSIVLTSLSLVGLPLILLIFFKANVGVMFLASCAGIVLLSTLDPAVVSTAGAVVPGEGEAYIRLAVVLLTIIFASMMFRNTIKHGHLFIHVLLVLIIGTMLWLLLPSVTGVSWLLENSKLEIWQDVNNFRTLIVTSGLSLALVATLTSSSGHKRKSKH